MRVSALQDDESGSYFGCIVGRVANRIKGAQFQMPSGQIIKLEANDPPHALHGGSRHWGRQEWSVVKGGSPNSTQVTLAHTSPDGDAGYPGTVQAEVTYSLEKSSTHPLPRLRIRMEASTDSVTPINMVQHTHWNLCGASKVSEARICISQHACSTSSSKAPTLVPQPMPLSAMASLCPGVTGNAGREAHHLHMQPTHT
jgi:aldose 1-epimerase